MSRYYTRVCNFYYGKESKNLVNKNIYPVDKQDIKADNDKGSAMDVMGLKPKIVH